MKNTNIENKEMKNAKFEILFKNIVAAVEFPLPEFLQPGNADNIKSEEEKKYEELEV